MNRPRVAFHTIGFSVDAEVAPLILKRVGDTEGIRLVIRREQVNRPGLAIRREPLVIAVARETCALQQRFGGVGVVLPPAHAEQVGRAAGDVVALILRP
jgi:hypothetical protein